MELNGTLLHENVEMKGPTPGGVTGKEAATGPVMFQGDHGPVAYRNIKITDGRGATRLVIWANGVPTSNVLYISLRNAQSVVYSPEALKFSTNVYAAGTAENIF